MEEAEWGVGMVEKAVEVEVMVEMVAHMVSIESIYQETEDDEEVGSGEDLEDRDLVGVMDLVVMDLGVKAAVDAERADLVGRLF
jgi:hypothetical protein